MKTITSIAAIALLGVTLVGCEEYADSDGKQRAQQERILQEGTAQTGMPAIKNFRERKLMKVIKSLCIWIGTMMAITIKNLFSLIMKDDLIGTVEETMISTQWITFWMKCL